MHQPAGEAMPVAESLKLEVEVAKGTRASMKDLDSIGRSERLPLPLHAYSAETTNLALDDNLRRTLGSALRLLEERVALTEKLRRRLTA
jgi:two-component system chemotaxis response regulator CheB